MLKPYIKKILQNISLPRKEAADAMELIIQNEVSGTEIGGFLIGLQMKGESIDEILGFVDTMEKHMVKVDLKDKNAIDVCGTGGDSSFSFNVSTTTALVAAGGGVTVAKHGNRSVSSKTGSADLFEELGVKIDLNPDQVKVCINEIGIGFFFAPLFHPAMKAVVPHRKNLGVRTVFNMLGPLLNPAQVKRQLVGAYDVNTAKKLAGVLRMRNYKKACTVHSKDGFDEVSPFDQNRIFEIFSGEEGIKEYTYGEYKTKDGNLKIQGSDPKNNAQITMDVLSGKKGPQREMTVLNTAFAFYVAGKVDTIDEGIQFAQQIIDNGSAKNKLAEFIKYSQSF